MPDRYAVFGNPIGHSKSPLIHAAFARQVGHELQYSAVLAPMDGFAAAVGAFRAAGGIGANVTVPFKEQAYRLCDRRTPRAELAGAVNTLSFRAGAVEGDNTDGAGLVADIRQNLGFGIANRHLLIMGAGGAARGVLGPLLRQNPASVVVANRTVTKAQELAARVSHLGPVVGCGYSELAGQHFDLIVNATAASLAGELPPLPSGMFATGALAYDMMYGTGDTPFMAFARREGAARTSDGLGMLVEQAAESFLVWRGVRPQTSPVIAMLRAG